MDILLLGSSLKSKLVACPLTQVPPETEDTWTYRCDKQNRMCQNDTLGRRLSISHNFPHVLCSKFLICATQKNWKLYPLCLWCELLFLWYITSHPTVHCIKRWQKTYMVFYQQKCKLWGHAVLLQTLWPVVFLQLNFVLAGDESAEVCIPNSVTQRKLELN